MTDPNTVFKHFTEKVANDFPDMRRILDQAKDGTITEGEALQTLSEMVMCNPDLGRRFQEAAMQALAPLREEDVARPLDHGGMVMHKKRGPPRLNPLFEAALIERAQLDGDMPELRTGGLPTGQAPAVAVETMARNPVAIGHMLKQASDEMVDKIADQEPHRQDLIVDAATLELVGNVTAAMRDQRDLMLDGKDDRVDIPEYHRGSIPAPQRVVQPSGSTLLALTPEEQKQGAWAFLSTTQGRRSAIKGLTQLIDVNLTNEGFDVVVQRFDPSSSGILAFHEWSVGIDGPGATSPAFSLIDIAAMSIAKGLVAKMGDHRGRVLLEVTPINTVDIRTVGWAGRLLSRDPLLSCAT